MRLFVRIFLWFWCAMILLIIVIVGSAPYLANFSQRPVHSEVLIVGRVLAVFEELEYRLHQQGESAMIDWLAHWQTQSGVQLFIINKNGQELLARTLPDTLQSALQQPIGQLGTLLLRDIRQGDDVYRLLLQPPTTATILPKLWPRIFGWRLLIAILVSGVVCFWLAMYLSKPIILLRGAAQKLAAGDLSARISPQLPQRGDEVLALGNDFDVMAERLQNLLVSQQQLLWDVSHELRSPLARMQVALGLAERKQCFDTALQARMLREIERLEQLIAQLLLLARVEQSDQAADENIDIVKLITDIVADAEFEGGHITIAPDMTTALVLGHYQWLYSAFENIVRNALKHTAENTAVEITLQQSSGHVEVCVRDYGQGVPSDKLKHLFDPFFRVDTARSHDPKHYGYGLGLAISQQVIHRHKGTISVDNALPQGLAFMIQLPLQQK